jgi:four helix bundle protein
MMATINRFEEIKAWQNARRLTWKIYTISSSNLFSKDYNLKDQIRRSAISIMSNIAEGFESHTQPMFIKYLGQAKASAGELRSHAYVAYDLEYISGDELRDILETSEIISRQIFRFVQYLKGQPNRHRM